MMLHIIQRKYIHYSVIIARLVESIVMEVVCIHPNDVGKLVDEVWMDYVLAFDAVVLIILKPRRRVFV